MQHDLSPTLVTKWSGCDHYLTKTIQKKRIASGSGSDFLSSGHFEEPDEEAMPKNFMEMLFKKGLLHEKQCLERYVSIHGEEKIYQVDGPRKNEEKTWTEWVERVGKENLLSQDYEVIFQMPFKYNGMRGIADFLERREYETINPETGETTLEVCYEPVDSKLTRTSAKISHIKQLLFYSEAIQSSTKGAFPEEIHVALGMQGTAEDSDSSRAAGLPILQSFKTSDFRWQWQRTRELLNAIVQLDDEELGSRTKPKWCSSCAFCEFLPECSKEWGDDPLHEVYGILETHIENLSANGIKTSVELALLPEECIPNLDSSRNLREENNLLFNRIVPGLEERAGLKSDEVAEKWKVSNQNESNGLDDLVLTRLWRQARLQAIKAQTAKCPDCGQEISESAVKCSNADCGAFLITRNADIDNFVNADRIQGEGIVAVNFFSQKELKDKMLIRSDNPDYEDWQLSESLLHLPEMSDGDVYLDFEGHPFWTIEEDIIFLFGYIVKEGGSWEYKELWSHDADGNPSKESESENAEKLINYFHERRKEFPDMKVYHYNHTERFLLSQLTASETPMSSILSAFSQQFNPFDEISADNEETTSGKLNKLIKDGVFVDLLAVIRNSCQVGCRGYSLKSLEKVAGFSRLEQEDIDLTHLDHDLQNSEESSALFANPDARELNSSGSEDITAGAGAVYEYELYANYENYRDENGLQLERDSHRLEKIRKYNWDDVEATKEVHRWLLSQREKLDDVFYSEPNYERPDLEPSEIDLQIMAFQQSVIQRVIGANGVN